MADLTHAQLTRMIWIDALLVSRGTIRRADIQAAFGLSEPQAAVDLRQYRLINPGRIEHDRKRRIYRTVNGSSPAFSTKARMALVHAVTVVGDVMKERCSDEA